MLKEKCLLLRNAGHILNVKPDSKPACTLLSVENGYIVLPYMVSIKEDFMYNNNNNNHVSPHTTQFTLTFRWSWLLRVSQRQTSFPLLQLPLSSMRYLSQTKKLKPLAETSRQVSTASGGDCSLPCFGGDQNQVRRYQIRPTLLCC